MIERIVVGVARVETAQKAYDKTLNDPHANKNGAVVIQNSKDGPSSNSEMDLGCRGKAVKQVYGDDSNRNVDFKKFDSLFKDIQATINRIKGLQANALKAGIDQRQFEPLARGLERLLALQRQFAADRERLSKDTRCDWLSCSSAESSMVRMRSSSGM